MDGAEVTEASAGRGTPWEFAEDSITKLEIVPPPLVTSRGCNHVTSLLRGGFGIGEFEGNRASDLRRYMVTFF